MLHKHSHSSTSVTNIRPQNQEPPTSVHVPEQVTEQHIQHQNTQIRKAETTTGKHKLVRKKRTLPLSKTDTSIETLSENVPENQSVSSAATQIISSARNAISKAFNISADCPPVEEGKTAPCLQVVQTRANVDQDKVPNTKKMGSLPQFFQYGNYSEPTRHASQNALRKLVTFGRPFLLLNEQNKNKDLCGGNFEVTRDKITIQSILDQNRDSGEQEITSTRNTTPSSVRSSGGNSNDDQTLTCKFGTLLTVLENNPFPAHKHASSSTTTAMKGEGLPCKQQLDSPGPFQLCASAEKAGDVSSYASLDHFEFIEKISEGQFGPIFLVRHKYKQTLLALKVIEKAKIMDKKKAANTLLEFKVLQMLTQVAHQQRRDTNRGANGEEDSEFFTKLQYAFQTDKNLFLALEYACGGDLFEQYNGIELPDSTIRFYIANLVLALEVLHNLGIVHRDIKGENAVIGSDGYLKLTDFGLSKNGMLDGNRTYSLCGTNEFIAPEVLNKENKEGYGFSFDWWSLGCLLFEIKFGQSPFFAMNTVTVREKILGNQLQIPRCDVATRDLLGQLLQKDPTKRLVKPSEIKAHPFFKGIDWDALALKQVRAPFKPQLHKNYLNCRGKCPQIELDKVQAASAGAGNRNFGDQPLSKENSCDLFEQQFQTFFYSAPEARSKDLPPPRNIFPLIKHMSAALSDD